MTYVFAEQKIEASKSRQNAILDFVEFNEIELS